MAGASILIMIKVQNYLSSSMIRAAFVVMATLMALGIYHEAVFHTPIVMIQRAGPQSPFEKISLPHSDSGAKLPQRIAIYTIVVQNEFVVAHSALIKPDDCVRRVVVNKVDLPLPSGNRCLSPNPVAVVLEPHLKRGPNEIVLTVENTGGPYGLRLTFAPKTVVIVGYLVIVAIGALVALYQRSHSKYLLILTLIAIPYYLYWVPYYGNYGQSNDLYGHIGYIRHMSKEWAHPYAYTGRERWHPPTYYLLAGLVYRFGAWIGIDPLTGVRLLSLCLFSLFSAYAVSTLRLLSRTTPLVSFYLAVLLLLFFPTSVLMATRISNDIALYAAWSAAFFYLVRWYQRLSSQDLRNVLIAIAVAVSIKSNAFILVGMLAVVVAAALFVRPLPVRALFTTPVAIGVGSLVIGSVVNSGRLLFGGTPVDQADGLHFGESGNDIPSLFHYVSFDVFELVKHPFRTGGLEPGFWPYVVRTMTFGEYQWRFPGYASVLVVAVFTLLVVTVLVTAVRMVMDRSTFIRDIPLLVGLFTPILGLGVFFYVKRWSVCQDFRFIYPVIIPLCALYMSALATLWSKKGLRPLYWCLLLNGLIVSGGAVVFYLGQYLYS